MANNTKNIIFCNKCNSLKLGSFCPHCDKDIIEVDRKITSKSNTKQVISRHTTNQSPIFPKPLTIPFECITYPFSKEKKKVIIKPKKTKKGKKQKETPKSKIKNIKSEWGTIIYYEQNTRIALVITDKYSLLKVTIKKDVSISYDERVFIGDRKRKIIKSIKSKITFNNLEDSFCYRFKGFIIKNIKEVIMTRYFATETYSSINITKIYLKNEKYNISLSRSIGSYNLSLTV